MIKKILSAILVMAMLLTLSVALFSCKDKDKGNEDKGDDTSNVKPDDNKDDTKPEKTKYTVTVVDHKGNPVSDVEITFHFESGMPMPFDTDENGQISQNFSSKVKASVTGVPAGYSYAKMNQQMDFDDKGNLTFTIIKEEAKAPLMIVVVDQDGNPVSGVSVQACDSEGSCRLPVTTDENGVAFYSYESVELHAQLHGQLPDGYSVEDPSAYYDFVNGVATIKLTKN